MQLISLLTTSATLLGLVAAVPTPDRQGPFPKCGILRFDPNKQDNWHVGITASATCVPVHPYTPNYPAVYYMIEEAGCECKFYQTKESCEKGDDVRSYRGPDEELGMFKENERPLFMWCGSV